jgi:hypothetical protein
MANADTVTMSATLKVGNDVTNIDITPIKEETVNDYNLVIFYNDKYYGSDKFICEYFEGVTINFKVRNDKDEEKKTVTTGKEVADKPSSGNFVRIKCGDTSKFYGVSEVVEPQQVDINFINENTNYNNGEESGKNVDIRDAAETDNKSKNDNNPMMKKNKNGIKLFSRNNTQRQKDNTLDDNNFYGVGAGGKRSRKAYHKSGRKASRKASRTAYRTAYRKLGRKSVGNKKRNRGTRKK